MDRRDTVIVHEYLALVIYNDQLDKQELLLQLSLLLQESLWCRAMHVYTWILKPSGPMYTYEHLLGLYNDTVDTMEYLVVAKYLTG